LGVVQNKDVEYASGNHARTADGYKKVYEDDIIVNIILCWMGAIGRCAYNGVTSPAYDVYKPRVGVSSRYYHYLFRTSAFSGECYKAGKGIMAMRWRTYSSQFRNIVVPFPAFVEQEEIADYLDERCKKIDLSIANKKLQIEKFHELKSRLISDVVTGKMDVRGIEIPDYEFVAESVDEEMDEADCEEQEDET
jgi:type I restriction enzyme S subunit